MSFWFFPTATFSDQFLSIGQLPVPLLNTVSSEGEVRRLIQSYFDDEPPESIANLSRELWDIRQQVLEDDIVLIPSAANFECYELIGPYRYQDGTHGFPARFLKSLPQAQVTRNHPFPHARYCAPIPAQGMAELLKRKLHIGRNRTARYVIVAMGSLLLLRFASLLISYLEEWGIHLNNL